MSIDDFEDISELNSVNDIVEVFDKNELNLDLTHLNDSLILLGQESIRPSMIH